MDYNTPFYIDNFEKVFQFAEFGDTQNFFLKFYYWIDRDKYPQFATPHGTYPALDKGLTAHNGKMILRTVPDVIGGDREFILLQERATDRTTAKHPNVIQVEQIYGYAPAVTHERGEQVDWTQPGYFDRSSSSTHTIPTSAADRVSYNDVTDEVRVQFSGFVPAALVVGAPIQLEAYTPGRTLGATVNNCRLTSERTNILRRTFDSIYIPGVNASFRAFAVGSGDSSTGTVDPHVYCNTNNELPLYGSWLTTTFNRYRFTANNNIGAWPLIGSDPGFSAYSRVRILGDQEAAQPRSIGAVVERTYFYRSQGMPVQALAFNILGADGQAVDVLSDITRPTLAQYQSMISNGDSILPRGESTGQVLGDVWFKDRWLIPAQLQ